MLVSHCSAPVHHNGVGGVYGYTAAQLATAVGTTPFAVRRDSQGQALRVYEASPRAGASAGAKVYVLSVQQPVRAIEVPDLTAVLDDQERVRMWRDDAGLHFAGSETVLKCQTIGMPDWAARFVIVDCGRGAELRTTAAPERVVYTPPMRVAFVGCVGEDAILCGEDEHDRTRALRCDVVTAPTEGTGTVIRKIELGVSADDHGILDIDGETGRVLVSSRPDDDGERTWTIVESGNRRQVLGRGAEFGFFMHRETLPAE
jgi:hypothetical protein